MARLSKEELQRIVEAEVPGYTVAERPPESDATASRVAPDASTPDVETLRQKYGGESAAPRDEAPHNPGNPHDDPAEKPTDSAIVIIEPKDASDDRDRDAGRKAVVISP